MQGVTDGGFNPGESSVVKEPGRQSQIAEWSRTKLIAISFVAGKFFQAEILIRARTVKDYVALPHSKLRGVLRNADHAFLEVGKHLVGFAHRRAAGNSVTLHAPGFAEEKKRSAFLGRSHSASVASGEFVNGRVSKDEREFKFGNGFAEHKEIDRCAGGHFREYLAKKLPVGRACVKQPQSLLTDGLVARSRAGVRQRHDFAFAIIKLAKRRS